LPIPFIEVARAYRSGDPPILEHFAYDENRQFFLADLYRYLLQLEKNETSKRLPQT
jgi:hypothetical protein